MKRKAVNRKNFNVSFSIPDDRRIPQRILSYADTEFDNDSTITSLNPAALAMTKALQNAKTLKKSWDSDKALKSTYKGLFGKYQLRVYLFVALGYGIVAAWLTEMPVFALLPPKHIDCTPFYPNQSNLTNPLMRSSNRYNLTDIHNFQIRRAEPVYNYTNEHGRTVLTEFNKLCDKRLIKIPYIVYILGMILGGLIFGYIADYSGRKMILLGSIWAACAMSLFQLLSGDYISYVFFIFFVGLAIGAVHVIAIPYIMEMFPIESRAMYSLSLLGIVFLLDLVIPWLAILIKNWKFLQLVISMPLIFTAVLFWCSEESMFWFTTQKDYVSAVLSLTNIARYNGVVFEEVFSEARSFLSGKHSRGIQCDFQPLLRLEDIKSLSLKYPDFDMVDLQATSNKKKSFTQRILQIITGHHYYPTLSTFYPTDYLHSPILTIYLLVMCGLWLVSALTEYSLDIPHLTQHLTDNFFWNYFYTHLIQILSFVVAVPLVVVWGRRWPTFCFFLIAEVCLLGSIAVKLDEEQTRTAMLVVYFIGKFATRAAFIVLIIYTCEIFPTGLRCTTLGICYTFRWIGVALASPDVGEVNGWMPRLIYGILALIIGSLALLLPETKKFPLPRTMIQVEVMPTSVSKKFRRRRSTLTKRSIRPDGTQPDATNAFSDSGSVFSATRYNRPYDNQSTLHSIYELQEFDQDDAVPPFMNRNLSRRTDPRQSSAYQPYSTVNNETFRHQQSIAEDVEATDIDDDRIGYAHRSKTPLQQRNSLTKSATLMHTDDDVIVLPPTTTGRTSISRHSASDVPTQLEATAQIQAGHVTDDSVNVSNDDKLSQSPRYQRTMSQDENYFSEHC
ncbi:unnamed protein product [Adineta ricciae]|uniref:Major facilitator superfamily (MFS) profile domain-containing protein n=1 Tax=Adineta ricciae TaxID=249248 RepID=A0A814I2E1_ADIRI|nr:unnamed protein product [Adineta ricciae]